MIPLPASYPITIRHSVQRETRAARWLMGGVGTLAFFVAATLSWVAAPVPAIHDEFSYLLGADTLLHGRFANPPLEDGSAFQTFHVIVEPSYASKYPLGQSLWIACGWWLTGVPIAGSWMAAGACAAAVTWMLLGALPLRWAALGGLLVALHPVMQTVWSQHYVHGWLPATGSALLIGALFRARRRLHTRDGWLAGAGLFLLATVRPFEGFVSTIIVGLTVIAILCMNLRRCGYRIWMDQVCRRWLREPRVLVHWCVGVLVPIFAAVGLLAAQNHATTGSIFHMPYQVHEQQFARAPLFVFQSPVVGTASDSPEHFRDFHDGWSMECYRQRQGFVGWLSGWQTATNYLKQFWGWSLGLLPWITWPLWRRSADARLVALVIVAHLLISTAVVWISPHYLAAMVPWLVLLAVIGTRRVVRLPGFTPTMRSALIAGLLLLSIGQLLGRAKHLAAKPQLAWARQRAAIQHQLQQQSGEHLVLVRYAPHHNVHQEWVYNGAELTSNPIVWAHQRDPSRDAELLRRFADRTVWQLDADARPPRIIKLRSFNP